MYNFTWYHYHDEQDIIIYVVSNSKLILNYRFSGQLMNKKLCPSYTSSDNYDN